MRVHVVCREFNHDAILPRLARMLTDRHEWTLGEGPDAGADVNHFSSYIEFAERHSDFFTTPTSAFFTHYEENTPYKAFWWDLANERIGLRLTCAPMYLARLQACGPAAPVRPPLDRGLFRPAARRPKAHDPPVVGVSGFVDRRSGRKGEHLLARLAGSALGGQISLIGSGRGWPVPTHRRSVIELPAFYQSLDVYLCTATVEGIPMPPLEALACGIPIVIPIGVGMLDELPDLPGLYRYPAGDYAAMEAAVRRACFEPDDWDPERLRAATEPYTVENWIGDHRKAFEELLHLPRMRLESDLHGKRGVYYVAYGGPARKCAESAMALFREHVQGVEIAVAAKEPIGPEDVWIDAPDADIGGRSAKTRIYDLAPENWQYIMYLDADTEVVADISWLFQPLLDGWDMVICKNPGKYHLARYMRRSDNGDECEHTFKFLGTDEVLQLNGGVFTFQRNERTAAFFRCWHEEWNRWGKRDQGALLRALWRHPVRLFVLTNHWNTITRYVDGDPRRYTAGILHYPMTARRWRGIVRGRSDSAEAWGQVRQWEEGQK